MGRAAIPLLLAERTQEPDDWFHARMHALTGVNPVPEAKPWRCPGHGGMPGSSGVH